MNNSFRVLDCEALKNEAWALEASQKAKDSGFFGFAEALEAVAAGFREDHGRLCRCKRHE